MLREWPNCCRTSHRQGSCTDGGAGAGDSQGIVAWIRPQTVSDNSLQLANDGTGLGEASFAAGRCWAWSRSVGCRLVSGPRKRRHSEHKRTNAVCGCAPFSLVATRDSGAGGCPESSECSLGLDESRGSAAHSTREMEESNGMWRILIETQHKLSPLDNHLGNETGVRLGWTPKTRRRKETKGRMGDGGSPKKTTGGDI